MIPIWCLIIIGAAAIIAIQYHWSRRELYKAALKYSGPWALPLVGSALIFNCKNEDILGIIYETVKKYTSPMCFWLGPKLVIIFSQPDHVEKIMSSSKLAYKHEIYDFLKVILGEGLVTASGPVYKSHRRKIQPLFNLSFCGDQMDVFQRHIDKCIMKLDQFIGKGEFDIHLIIHKCVVDIIGEIVLGCAINAQEGQNKSFIQAFIDIYDHGLTRLTRPWLYPEVLYKLTKHKKKEIELQVAIRGFMEQVIAESANRRKSMKNSDDKHIPIIDQMADFREKDPECMNEEDFMSHLVTLYAASEDTLTIISSCMCVCLGMYPEYQRRVGEEIRDVFGEKPRPVTLDDIGKLQYLDMCIKDTERLMPIAPYILRRTLEDHNIDQWPVPKGTALLIPIYNLHHDKNYWENPEHFHPDHFLPEVVKKRHVYSYLPFSAGPRGCVGKIFANMALKCILANLLQRYEFEANGKFPDLKLRMDISVRPINGYLVKIKRRH